MEYQLPIVVLARTVTAESAQHIAASWKMSNEESSALIFQVQARDVFLPYKDVFALVAQGKWSLQQAVDYFAVAERWKEYELIRQVEFPSLPINGGDLIKIGHKPGPAFKGLLEQAWISFIKSRYTKTKEELIDELLPTCY